MLDILAKTFMTATRSTPPDYPAAREERRRWLPQGHWWYRAGETPGPTRR
ncbi:hypothetical protein [Pseudodonghicola flavimaris]|uniref:Uncharacterized protein n=1 Tax=Pseudodonghicola flavimaris TaxID=3050036 RepID=A0ABT7EXB9_9RHOB|nr:hypothetical protein [Pseudodonghicola flavimaris]MDK3016989.1 hypothetical protein [Pseudodonghicola flavimaris]